MSHNRDGFKPGWAEKRLKAYDEQVIKDMYAKKDTAMKAKLGASKLIQTSFGSLAGFEFRQAMCKKVYFDE